ncbi:hypothetical protein BD410DRAFT_809050 [Rickenella mellea]|uniref:Uncharacterized protein n=1 Tax=Rickenella mellea TaxID=50990 RepID=A0A4Y7PL54_9AGAM|nr:hypothetical protein BD410DRAFT_809050 [Rickenella mellea]
MHPYKLPMGTHTDPDRIPIPTDPSLASIPTDPDPLTDELVLISTLLSYPTSDGRIVCCEEFPKKPILLCTTGLVTSSKLHKPVETANGKGSLKEIGLRVIPVEWDRQLACIFQALEKGTDFTISNLLVSNYAGDGMSAPAPEVKFHSKGATTSKRSVLTSRKYFKNPDEYIPVLDIRRKPFSFKRDLDDLLLLCKSDAPKSDFSKRFGLCDEAPDGSLVTVIHTANCFKPKEPKDSNKVPHPPNTYALSLNVWAVLVHTDHLPPPRRTDD